MIPDESRPFIDLTRHHFVRELGQFRLYGSWVFNEDKEDTEPCLIIVNAHRNFMIVPVVVALSAAYKYTDGRYMARACSQFLKVLDIEDTVSNNMKLANLIFDHLGDLISMPPDPTEAVVVGEGTIKTEYGNKTVQLLDHVPQDQI